MQKNEIVIESKTVDLDRVFAECGRGYKAIIKRVEPAWCDGVIETLEIDPDEPISMDYIAQTYGGRKLQIVIQDGNGTYVTSRTIKFPFPPRYEGRELIREGDARHAGAVPLAQPTQQASGIGEMKTIIEMMMASQERQLAGLLTIMEKRLDAVERAAGTLPQKTPQGEGGPMAAIKESLAAIKQIKEMGFTQPEKPPSMFEGAVEKFTDMMIEREQAKIKADLARAAQTPAAPALGPGSTYTAPAPGGPSTAPQTNAAMIAGLSDLELTAHVKNRLETMDPDTRSRLLNQIAESLDLEVDDDDEHLVVDQVDEHLVVDQVDEQSLYTGPLPADALRSGQLRVIEDALKDVDATNSPPLEGDHVSD